MICLLYCGFKLKQSSYHIASLFEMYVDIVKMIAWKQDILIIEGHRAPQIDLAKNVNYIVAHI